MRYIIKDIEEAKVRAAEMFMHFSDILAIDVRDKDGNFLGELCDIAIKRGEIYPKADEIVVERGLFKKLYASFSWTKVTAIEDYIVINVKADEVRFRRAFKNYDFLLKRDVLDQQVVDTYNHKVRRVNDIHLLRVDHELMVAHVDIGLRSLVRRIGWEKAVDILVKIVNKNASYLKKEELVSWKYVQPVAVNPASMTMKLSVSEKQILSIPPADLGEIIFDLNPKQRIALFTTLDVKTKARIFENLEPDEQKSILKDLDKKDAAEIVASMSSDEATDLLERLPTGTVANLLTLIESGRSKKLSTLLGYSSDSAGGLMTTELVSIRDTMTVGEAIEYLKDQTKEYDIVPFIYLVDEKNRLKGVTTVRRLLFSDAKDAVAKTAFPNTIYVYLKNSVKEVAYLMDKYKNSAIPVIDENKVLQGVITMDDILSQVISIAWRKRLRKQKGL
jgi:CBS domain-containing protein/sporulation protein YlmC with PRC-barrel domain